MIVHMKSWRTLVLLVLSVLLPWRSAMSITMPVTTAPPALQAGLTLADSRAHAHDETASGPHHGSLEASAADACHASLEADTQHSHSLCDVCNGPALGPVSALPLPAHTSPVGPVHGAVHFASRAVPIVHKPPIPV